MKNVIVGIKDKEGTRTQRLNLADGSALIGRGWNNDIVIQDRFIDAEHLSLSLDVNGDLCVSDLSSTNGSMVAGKALLNDSCALSLDDEVKLGDTCLLYTSPSPRD